MPDYIKNAGLKFTQTPTRRKVTKGIVIHHPAAKQAHKRIDTLEKYKRGGDLSE